MSSHIYFIPYHICKIQVIYPMNLSVFILPWRTPCRVVPCKIGLLLIVLVALIWVAASQLIEPWKSGRDDGDLNGDSYLMGMRWVFNG